MRPMASMFSWIHHSMTRVRHVLLLSVIIYASTILFWSAYKMNPFSQNGHNSRIQIPSQLVFNNSQNLDISIQDFPIGETKTRQLQCIKWRTLYECSLIGKIWSSGDQNCSTIISNDKIGYCEVEDVNTKEKFRVMQTQCNSFRHGVPFRCQDAPQFVNIRVQAHKIVQAAQNSSLKLPHVNITIEAKSRDGIVMVVYPKLLASAYATIRVLRTVLKCQLPIEIWFRSDELKKTNRTSLEPLKHLAATENNITFQEIHDSRATGFVTKIHAIYHTNFDRVLFLDADNVPVRDPSFLFESTEFLKTGAIFWPDFWNPDHSIFGVYENSLLWELLDMPFIDMFEQESGQLVIDRRRHAVPLELVRFYALNRPNFFTSLKLVWGDKDLFRLAWLKLNVPFTMIQTPPGMAGIISDGFFRSDFCGMTMVQHDANGEILFMHRNQQKLSGKIVDRVEDARTRKTTIDAVDVTPDTVEKYADSAIWAHVLEFHKEYSRRYYYVDMFRVDFDFEANQRCFGQRAVYRNPYFYIQEIAALNFSRLESQLRHFALESMQLFSSKNQTFEGKRGIEAQHTSRTSK